MLVERVLDWKQEILWLATIIGGCENQNDRGSWCGGMRPLYPKRIFNLSILLL
jgi:hypothetical protein